MNYYVYYSYEPFGRGYIGCRRCECDPKCDTYFGSYRDKTFKPTEKIILEVFDTYELAIECEVKLHTFFEVSINPHFANLSRQTSTKFTTAGTTRSKETKERHKHTIKQNPQKYGHGNSMRGKNHSEKTKRKMSDAAKQQTYTEETRKKMSESAKLRKPTIEEKVKISYTLKNKPSSPCPHCGKMLKDQYLNRHIRCYHEEG